VLSKIAKPKRSSLGRAIPTGKESNSKIQTAIKVEQQIAKNGSNKKKDYAIDL
jgi:hypothetical protein